MYIALRSKIPDITNLATNTTPNTKINGVKGEIPSITNLDINSSPNAKINGVKNKIPNISNLDTTTALIAAEKKIPKFSSLVKKTLILTQKLVKLKRKLLLIMIMINLLLLKSLMI